MKKADRKCKSNNTGPKNLFLVVRIAKFASPSMGATPLNPKNLRFLGFSASRQAEEEQWRRRKPLIKLPICHLTFRLGVFVKSLLKEINKKKIDECINIIKNAR
jgi:hypothetical protein